MDVQPVKEPLDPNSLRAAYVDASGAVTNHSLPVQPTALVFDSKGLIVSPQLALGQNDTVFASYGSDLMSFNPATTPIGACRTTFQSAG